MMLLFNQDLWMNFFGNEAEYSETMRTICAEHTKLYPDDDIIDLRPKSPFSNQLSESVFEAYLKEMEDKTERLIPEKLHNFLVGFFSQELTSAEWQNKIDDLRSFDNEDVLMVATVRVIRRTLPQL
jgi:hypothetical protein